VAGPFRTDSAAAIHTAVAQGVGLGRARLWQIRALVDAGGVEVILKDFEVQTLPICAVLPPARVVPAKTRLFVDLLALRLKNERW
jgi:DNA-binding transcriptional LysR family regulator